MVNVDASEAAPKAGVFITVVDLILGLFGAITSTGNIFCALWTIACTIPMSMIEIPRLWNCIDRCAAPLDFIMNKLKLTNWYLRGAVYILVSIVMYIGGAWPLELSGALTTGLGLFYWAAEYQGLRDDTITNADGETYDQF
eukprot:g892.t1